jgi:hypothetical protein
VLSDRLADMIFYSCASCRSACSSACFYCRCSRRYVLNTCSPAPPTPFWLLQSWLFELFLTLCSPNQRPLLPPPRLLPKQKLQSQQQLQPPSLPRLRPPPQKLPRLLLRRRRRRLLQSLLPQPPPQLLRPRPPKLSIGRHIPNNLNYALMG